MSAQKQKHSLLKTTYYRSTLLYIFFRFYILAGMAAGAVKE